MGKNIKLNSKKLFNYLALFTIIPVVAFVGIKMILTDDFFELNASIIILAFAWLTGTQLFLSFFKVSKADSLKVIFALVSSFIIILFTYELIGMELEHFLYGENAVLFYKAATFNVTTIMTLVMLVAIMLAGWFFMYTQHFAKVIKHKEQDSLKLSLYKFLAKEGYFFNIIESLKGNKK